MVADRALAQVLASFTATVVGDFSSRDVLSRLAEGAVQALDVDGAGIMVPDGEDMLRFAYAAGPSVAAVAAAEQMQEDLQTGPCRDTFDSGIVINIADLAVEGAWPGYQAQVLQSGLRAVTAFPLVARGRTWGVLDLYRLQPRRLGTRDLRTARTLADVATSYLVVTADRDAARQAQAELAHRAMHDLLTGLPVRWVFLEQLAHALARLARHPGHVAVLFVDVDGLKYVNDTYGHHAGDQLLVTCAERIRGALRPTDVLARLGGDEFVVLLEDVDGPGAAAVARRVLAELAPPYRSEEGQLVQPSASLGLAVTDDPEHTPEALITHADSAMYQAKRLGRGRFQLFDAPAYAAAREHANAGTDLAGQLRSGLQEGQLTLHYQPIIELEADGAAPRADRRPWPHGDAYAVEALARWQHPQRGLLTADQFIPQAERAGLMPEVGAYVVAAACRQLAVWDLELADRAPRRLFVNVSVDELTSPDFVHDLTTVLDKEGLDAGRLTLELTETGLMTDPFAAEERMRAVRELGCQLAIDDFGAGYSSLSRLVDLPASTVKVDRSFTRDLAERPAAMAVVSAVLALGQQLDRTVVVEGVEDEEALRTLRQLGCTHVQGYHSGRPEPPAVISARCRRA